MEIVPRAETLGVVRARPCRVPLPGHQRHREIWLPGPAAPVQINLRREVGHPSIRRPLSKGISCPQPTVLVENHFFVSLAKVIF